MRLISCRINGFGKFKNASFDFGEGITSVCEENGFGKSTLADFIKVMFYGLPTSKRGQKSFDDRTHYAPLGGGAFGGSIKIEVGGKIYRIEREFDRKSETRDVLKLTLEDGTEITPPEEGIGEKLFGVDEESFVRTAYISRDGTEAEATPSINRKLNDLVDGDGEANYENAVKNLVKAYKAIRADRGREGSYYAALDEKAKCEVELASLRNIDLALGEKYNRLNSLGGEIKKATDAYNRAVHEKAVVGYFERYDGYIAAADRKKAEADRIRAKYPMGMPTREECSSVRAAYGKKAETESRIAALAAEEKALPDSEKLDDISKRCAEYSALKKSVDLLKSKKKVGTKAVPLQLIVLLFVFGALMMVGGGVLYYIFRQLYTFILSAAGLVAIITAIVFAAVRTSAGSARVSIKEKSEKLARSEGSLKEVFSAYSSLAEDIPSSLVKLTERITMCREGKKRASEDLTSLTGTINLFYAKYDVRRAASFWDDIMNIENDISRAETLYADAERTLAEADNYRFAKNLTSRPDGTEENIERIEASIKRLRAQYASLGAEIAADERSLSAMSALEERAFALGKKAAELDEKYSLLKKTLRYVIDAENSLREKYIAPVMDLFCEYAAELSPEAFDMASMNFEYKLSFEKDGIMRGDEYFSSGQRRCIELCLRLALVKNMYKTESPFIIMDDPFALLDEEHMQKAQNVLRKAAEDMQIIYFCPHESRLI